MQFLQYFLPENFNYLYNLIEAVRFQLLPTTFVIKESKKIFENQYIPMHNSDFVKIMRATLEISERIVRRYRKPEFGITKCEVGLNTYAIEQNVILKKTFCNLVHFRKVDFKNSQPKLLIVAPLAGHHATLLRGAVEGMLPYSDVYITDWIDASQIPLTLGSFNMDDFIDYVIEFMHFLEPRLHVMAVCQPTVPVLAAVAIMSAENTTVPKSIILIGGPVDARQQPTQINHFAMNKSIEWFQHMVVTMVPPNYPGYMRYVYPGFLQLAGFISMNIQNHVTSHIDMFKNLVIEDDEKASVQKKFYDEYLSVMDIPAEFYLQTIKEVFQDFSLAKGILKSRDRAVKLEAIVKCALLGIEGENDDIAAVGQTKEALNLCKSIPDDMKQYHLQKGVGHYGVFSGSKFRKHIVPVIRNFICEYN